MLQRNRLRHIINSASSEWLDDSGLTRLEHAPEHKPGYCTAGEASGVNRIAWPPPGASRSWMTESLVTC